MLPLLLGIDIGTTNIKAIVFDPHGQIVASASVKTRTHYPRPNWAYYKPDELWADTVKVIQQAVEQVEQPQRIVSVAVASVAESAVPIDAQGQPTYDSIAWFDTRSEPQQRWLDEHIGHQRLFEISGLSLQPIFGLCKVLWLREHEPDAYKRSTLWLNIADYIAYRLCGEVMTNYSLASRTLVLNLRKLQWDEPLLNELGIPASYWGPLAAGGIKIGNVLPEVASATGLPTSCAVATGGHDHVCAALVLGAHRPGILLDSMGTAEAMMVSVETPTHDPRSGEQGYGQGAHVIDGYYMMGGLTTSSACIEWLRDMVAPGVDYAELIAEAEQVPMGSLGVTFMPHLRIANVPNLDPLSRGCFIGLSGDVTRGVLFRAVLEGLALEYYNGLTPLLGYAGLQKLDAVYATGGGTRNHLLMQIKASVFNQSYQVVSMDEATALGAAVLGGLGGGVYKDVSDAISHMRYSATTIEPIPAQADYYAQFYEQVYRHLYSALKPLNHALFRLNSEKLKSGKVAA